MGSESEEVLPKANIIKINLYSLFVNNYYISYERLITKKISFQLGYRYQPYEYLAENFVGKKLSKLFSIDPRYYNFKTSNNSVTADVKFYLGRKAPQGLYLGLYGRYTAFDVDNIDYTYILKNESVYSVPLISNVKGVGVGGVIGIQWLIKKRISLEYYIIGGHYGKLSGKLKSEKDLSDLSDEEKSDLKENVEDLFTISNKKYLTSTISDRGIDGKISGPFFGARSGICVGIAF